MPPPADRHFAHPHLQTDILHTSTCRQTLCTPPPADRHFAYLCLPTYHLTPNDPVRWSRNVKYGAAIGQLGCMSASVCLSVSSRSFRSADLPHRGSIVSRAYCQRTRSTTKTTQLHEAVWPWNAQQILLTCSCRFLISAHSSRRSARQGTVSGCYAAWGGLKPTFQRYLLVLSRVKLSKKKLGQLGPWRWDRYFRNVGSKTPHAAQ
jgi:hypothetical protein